VSAREKIRSFVVSNFYLPSGARLKDDTSLIEEGIIDSTGVLELLAFVEKEFGIRTADEDIVPENFDGIARITAFVEARRAGAGDPALGKG